MSGLESDHVPQHDAAGSRLQQPEVDERHDSIVVEGEDAGHVLPPIELDPYTPEPAPGQRAASALWIAIVVLLLVVAAVVYAATR
ncbi:MAG: hypothetical protein M3P41_12770 [Actinomycetota bacterium]|nr:hypothetical protein [Actinomycetota bacterium]